MIRNVWSCAMGGPWALPCDATTLAQSAQRSQHLASSMVTPVLLLQITVLLLMSAVPVAAEEPEPAAEAPAVLPHGPYSKSCQNCSLVGDSLVCEECSGGSSRTSISLSSCEGFDAGGLNRSASLPLVNNTAGYLTCKWRQVHPPRVGALTGNRETSVDRTCRYFSYRTFIAPQMPPSGGVLETVSVTPAPVLPPCAQPPCPKVPGMTPRAAEQCCAACINNKRCKAWTVDGHRCSLVGDVNTDYPTAKSGIISGYPLSS
eukprot:SAG31_NODE_11114_length_1064_cov_2.340933_1_plen_259_part_10